MYIRKACRTLQGRHASWLAIGWGGWPLVGHGALALVFGCGGGVTDGIGAELLEGGILEKFRSRELLTEIPVDTHTLDIAGHVELLQRGDTRALDAEGEDTKVINAHGLALQQELTETDLHLAQYSAKRSLGEDAMMVGNVLDELVEGDGLVRGAGVPLTLGQWVGALVEFVTNHNFVELKD